MATPTIEALQRELDTERKKLALMREISRALSSPMDLDRVLFIIVEKLTALMDADRSTLYLLSEGGESLSSKFRGGGGEIAEIHLALGEGIAGWVAQTGQTVNIRDAYADERFQPRVDLASGYKTDTILCAPMHNQDGQLVGVLQLINKSGGTFEGNDEELLKALAGQVALSIQLARAKQLEDESQRLASIGQMLAGVLHDLRTPMTIISGYAQLMAQSEDAAERGRFVDEILHQFELMNGMTKTVLSFARGESNILVRKVYVQKFMEQVATQLRHALSEGVELVVDDKYGGVAYFDEQAIFRVAHNLARNAARAMNDSGVFRVDCCMRDDHLELSFSDNGPGIPVKLRGRLFQLFASETSGGTGLGLAICRKLVEAHNGEISYESQPGKGTTFFVRLPKSSPP